MRFFPAGPAIPDELLVARDEGRVVLFCGAGVSQAWAGLPDFFGLATKVSDMLGVTDDSPARRIIREASQLDDRIGVTGLIPADRVFGLLEREFRTGDIESAVARALIAPKNVDLSAHRILIDLARTSAGKVQLVTTNFDLLFEACDGTLRQWEPPRLPDPKQAGEIDGIVHLHGRVNDRSDGAFGDGFVLSSSEFGNAYLADGWATQFIRAVLDNYLVVFVGYTADDPPVQYLLEALNRRSDLGRAYAFQSGRESDAESKWRHKGVEAIPYDPACGHKSLWESLAAWSERARDPVQWYDKTIELARYGPAALAPHERGQVAHIISTLAGARRFAGTSNPPPADWLCVFDPYVRYGPPRKSFEAGETEQLIDPFDSYGLDSDPVPQQLNPKGVLAKREVPEGIWNGLSLTRLDKENLSDSNYAAVRGHWAANIPSLAPRLWQIGRWLSQVVHQPISAWWAAAQTGLHPEIRNQLFIQLEKSKDAGPKEVRRAWRYTFEAWETSKDELRRDWYGLKAQLNRDGWSSYAIRQLESIYRPYLKAERPYSAKISSEPKLGEMVRLDVEYPNQHEDPEIPDEWLPSAVQAFRKNLEVAVRLENELSEYGLASISPIEADPDVEGTAYQREHGISKCVLFFAAVYQRLLQVNRNAAKQEYQSWSGSEWQVFGRLRIWAAGQPELLKGPEVGCLIASLPDEVFWDAQHARDLLITISKRWNDLSDSVQKRIENRMLRGWQRRKGENKGDFEKRRAFTTLNRVYWMKNQGCRFHLALDTKTARLRAAAEDWKPEYARHAAASREGAVGSVRTDKTHADLVTGPLDTVLARAQEQSGRIAGHLVESDPFAGLSASRPARALRVLTKAAKIGHFPEWAWRTFLNSEARKTDRPRLSTLIAYRLSNVPEKSVAKLITPMTDWLLRTSDVLFANSPNAFEILWDRLIGILEMDPSCAASAVQEKDDRHDWATEALNAPAGYLAQAILKDPTADGIAPGSGFPAKWLGQIERLLRLAGDHRSHVLVFLGFQLNWLFAIDPKWTAKNVLSCLDGVDDDHEALWAGFFWSSRVPSLKLYPILKPRLLEFARSELPDQRGYGEVLAGILLAAWGTVDESGSRCISNNEMRTLLIESSEDLRCRILWQLGNWGSEISDHGGNDWYEMLPIFLSQVWPRQKKANSARVSERLADIAFSSSDRFPEISEIILPLLSKIDRDHLTLPHIRNAEGSVLESHPTHSLALLHAILPDDVKSWPYGIEEILDLLIAADVTLKLDERCIELTRKWDAR